MNVAVDQLTPIIDTLSNEEGQLKNVITSLATNQAAFQQSANDRIAALQAEIADITTNGGVPQSKIDALTAIATGLKGDLDAVTALNSQVLQPTTPPADPGSTPADGSGTTSPSPTT